MNRFSEFSTNSYDVTVYVDGVVFDRDDVLYADGELCTACAFARYFSCICFTFYHEGE